MISKDLEKTLSKLIKQLNRYESSDSEISYIQESKRKSLMLNLSAEVANLIASGLLKEQLRNRFLALGLKAEFFEELHESAVDIYEIRQVGDIKHSMLRKVLGGSEAEKEEVRSLLTRGCDILDEETPELEMIEKLRADTKVDALTAYAIFEMVEEFEAGFVDAGDFNHKAFDNVAESSTRIEKIALIIMMVVATTGGAIYFFGRTS